MNEEAIKAAKGKLKTFEACFAEFRDKLCPPDLAEDDRLEWIRGFDDTRRFYNQTPQSEFYDLGFMAGTDFRDDFFG